jgi:hypothetical protein
VSTSLKKQVANRANGRRGGVKTPQGKAISKYNARKHGLLSKELVIKADWLEENQEDFDALLEDLEISLNPVGSLEDFLVEKLAVSLWRTRRVIAFESRSIRGEALKLEPSFDRDRLLETLEHLDREIAQEEKNFLSLFDGIDRMEKACQEGVTSWGAFEDMGWDFLIDKAMNDLKEEEKKQLFEVQTHEQARLFIEEKLGWNDTHFLKVLIEISQAALPKVYQRIEELEKKKEEEKKKQQAKEDDIRKASKQGVCSSLPKPEDIERIVRYGTHLDRQFARDLELLMKLQFVRSRLGSESSNDNSIN